MRRPIVRRKAQKLSKPYPPVAEIPDCGLTLFDADWGRSYRFARQGLIVTANAGPRRRLALMFPTCAKLGIDPQN